MKEDETGMIYEFLEPHKNKYVGVNIDNTDRPVMGRFVGITSDGCIRLEKRDGNRIATVKIKAINAIEDLKEEEEEQGFKQRSGVRRY